MIVIEGIMGDIARQLGLNPLAMRQRNLYRMDERDVTHCQMRVENNIQAYLLSKLEQTSL